MADHQARVPETLWAYAYQIVPPQPAHRLRALAALLDRERRHPQLDARTWQGRIVLEPHATHILVVSDSPEVDRETNHLLEAELRKLRAGFAITAPLAVSDETAISDIPVITPAPNPNGATAHDRRPPR